MRGRGDNPGGNDGDSVHRICATIWANVIMRGDGDNKFSIGCTIYRGGHSGVIRRGVFSSKSNCR